MKKFLLLLAVLLVCVASQAGNWVSQSMLNPNIQTLLITNNAATAAGGVTNLAYQWQNQIFVGSGGVPTNQNQVMLTNKFNQLVILTNGAALPATVNLPGAAVIYEVTSTNGYYSTLNPFQDAYFNSDLNSSILNYPQPASSNQVSACLGLLSVVIVPGTFYPTGGSGTLTNNVQLVLEGIPFGPVAPQISPLLGALPFTLASQDTISGSKVTVTFTNAPQLGINTGVAGSTFVYQTPIMSTNFVGMRGIRIRSLNCAGTGVATNCLGIAGLLFSDWAP